MSSKVRGWYLFRLIYLIFLIITIGVYLSFRALFVIYGLGEYTLLQWNFVAVSILISLLALINYLITRIYDITDWQRFTLLLFIAMIFGTIGDFLLAGFLTFPVDSLIIGTVAFAIGQVFYLLVMRDLSPLLIARILLITSFPRKLLPSSK